MMPLRRPALWVCACLLLALVVLPAAAAAEESKADCASAYEKAQEARADGKLRKARDNLVICAQTECPAFVQTDCAQWLTEVQRELPSIVVDARGKDGNDTVDVRVLIDSEVLVEKLDGTAIVVDPGLHVFRFESPGAEPIEQKLLIRQGQRNRVVEVAFGGPPAAGGAPAESASESPASEGGEPAGDTSARVGRPGPLRPYAFVAGGVGVLGVASWAVFGLLGKSQQSDLSATCGKTSAGCSDAQISSVETKYLIADISLGTGVVGLGAGVALFLMSQPKPVAAAERPALRVGAAPLRGGGFASVSGQF